MTTLTSVSTTKAGGDVLVRSALHEIMVARPTPVALDDVLQATTFAIGERCFPEKTALIGDAAIISAAAQKALGVALPILPNTVSQSGGVKILWLAPNEWLVVTPMSDGGRTRGRLQKALTGIHALVVDVSDRWVALELRGSMVLRALTKGTSLDVEGGALIEGRCASTSLAQAQVILHQRSSFPTFDLFVDATFAEPLWQWLEQAAEEFGVTYFIPDT